MLKKSIKNDLDLELKFKKAFLNEHLVYEFEKPRICGPTERVADITSYIHKICLRCGHYEGVDLEEGEPRSRRHDPKRLSPMPAKCGGTNDFDPDDIKYMRVIRAVRRKCGYDPDSR